jgi:hypothetical protein
MPIKPKLICKAKTEWGWNCSREATIDGYCKKHFKRMKKEIYVGGCAFGGLRKIKKSELNKICQECIKNGNTR